MSYSLLILDNLYLFRSYCVFVPKITLVPRGSSAAADLRWETANDNVCESLSLQLLQQTSITWPVVIRPNAR